MIERFFQYRDPWGHGLSLWVVVGMVFLAPLIGLGLSRVRLENDITTWLPADDPDARLLKWFHENFEGESRVLVSWDGSSLADPRVERFAQALRAEGEFAARFGARHPEHWIADVTTPQASLRKMVENGIEPEVALERLTGLLIGPGLLKVRWSELGRATPELSRVKLQQAVEAAGLEVVLLPPELGQSLPAPAAEAVADETELDWGALMASPPHDLQLRARQVSYNSAAARELQETIRSLPEVEACFYAPGAPVAISINLAPEADQRPRAFFEYLPEVAAAVGIPPESLHLGGGPVSRYRLNKEAERALWNPEYPLVQFHKRSPIILSTLATVLLTYVLLRSFRLATLVLLASMYVTLAVVALIPATGKTLNMVLIVLPNLLMVLTTSGAIHLANYWKHEAALDPAQGIVRAVRMAWVPCLLASVTTAVGMASLLTSELAPVRDFGLYAAIGCLVSLAMILFGFPSLLAVWPGESTAQAEAAHRTSGWARLGMFLTRQAFLTITGCLALFAGAVYGLQWFETETKVIKYFPPHTRVFQDYQALEESLAGIVSVEVLIRFPRPPEVDVTEETAEPAAEQQLNILQRMEIVRRIEQQLADHPGVSGAISLADFRPESPDPNRSLPRYLATVRRTERAIFEERAEETRGFVQRVRQPLSVNSQGRPIEFREGDEIWRIRCQTAILNDLNFSGLVKDLQQIVARETELEPGTEYVLTGMIPLFLRTQEALLNSLIESFGLAFGLIAVIMVILLRNLTSGLLAMLPNLYPVGVVFGLVAWMGIPVDIGTMITASVALGIAIDGTLHLITWFQSGVKQGLSRQEAVVASLSHCGPAMWQTSLAIALGMLLLCGADLLLISRFGWLMASLILVALWGDVVLLPALLSSGLGMLIERTIRRSGSSAAASSDQHSTSEAEENIVSLPLPAQPEQPQRRAAGLN
jgi:predicted RND superfamily exporter protein